MEVSFIWFIFEENFKAMELKLVYAICEQGDQPDDHCIIAIVDNLKLVNSILDNYYGETKITILATHDIRDSGVEYIKDLKIKDHKGDFYQVRIIVYSFCLNQI